MKIQHHEPHGPLRKAEYPDVGDQLDALVDLARALIAQGVPVSQKVRDWVRHCDNVKAKYRKAR